MVQLHRLYSFPGVAATDDHILGGLKQQECVLSRSRMVQGFGQAGSSRRLQQRVGSLPLSWRLVAAGSLCWSLDGRPRRSDLHPGLHLGSLLLGRSLSLESGPTPVQDDGISRVYITPAKRPFPSQVSLPGLGVRTRTLLGRYSTRRRRDADQTITTR